MKKTILTFIALALGVPAAFAQHVVFHGADGTVVYIPRENIESIEFTSGSEAQYEAVDLGLSVKWATVNFDLGGKNCQADSPEATGGYYGWADVTGEATSRDYANYGGANPPENISGTSYDIVHLNWGGNWRIPTDDEWTELHSKCTWTWTQTSAAAGYQVVGPSGKSIFLPAAGARTDNEIHSQGEIGCYWSGTLSPYDTALEYALVMWFSPSSVARHDAQRFSGLTIRPVSE